MAQAPQLYDFDIELHHSDRGIDEKLTLKAARHPSETLERVWLRVLAFCWLYEERLQFGPGLGDPEAPDLLTNDLTGRLTRWVRVGKSEAAKVQRAANQNSGAAVSVLFESPSRMETFIAEAKEEKLTKLGKVELAAIDPDLVKELASKDVRRTKLVVTLVSDHFYIDRAGEALDGALERGRLD
jgi:uncharacterized protein YaeQ